VALYRVRQFVLALAAYARPDVADEQAAAALLNPAALALFRRMSVDERRHSLRVLSGVRAAGGSDPGLLAAALLHDVGKTRARLWLWERPLPVLARALAPSLAERWGQGAPRGWRRAFVVAAQHAAWGAELAAAAGCSDVTVALIRHHQAPVQTAPPQIGTLLAVLQAADDRN
jgi:hypothetical protein